ncbi:MAG: hypothetical protein Q4B75_03250 [Eubacteriales bacterium]|nr:hypothetical protein [Eubacteriales bacterium]
MISVICADEDLRGLRGAMEESGVSITNLEVEDKGIYKDVDNYRKMAIEVQEYTEETFRK